MRTIINWLNQELYHNALRNYLLFVGILLAGILLKRVCSTLISRQLFRLVKDNSKPVAISEFVSMLRKPVEALFMLCIIYLAFDRLNIPEEWNWQPVEKFGIRMIADRLFGSLMIMVIAWVVIRFVKFIGLIFTKRAEKTDSKADDQLIPFFRDLGIIAIVILAIFAILDNVFNIDVAALITGLGIGGLALALAARETLENLFASFTIFLDLPFVVGDTVQVGQLSGDVEKVGFRSTRIRTADGSLVTIPNRLMTTQGLENLTQRQFRRAKFVLRFNYKTSLAQLQALITDIKLLIDTHEMTKPREGLVKFDQFGESSLDVLVIYHVETADWRIFNNVKEEINLQIIELIEKHGVQFAFPTRTIMMQADKAENDFVEAVKK